MKKLLSKNRTCILLWIAHVPYLWFLVLLCISDYTSGCDSSGPIKQFPHCIGYWPPEYNPRFIESINYNNYTPTMSTSIEDLKASTVSQERTIQVSILLPDSFTKSDINEIVNGVEEKEIKNETKSLNRNVGLEHIAFAQKRSGMGLLVGFQAIRKYKMIRDDIFFNITLRDSKCDSTFGQKTFLDSYTEKVHVLFGPACDLSLGKYTYEIDCKYIIFIVFALSG